MCTLHVKKLLKLVCVSVSLAAFLTPLGFVSDGHAGAPKIPKVTPPRGS
jgi:hypothetical protein